MDSEFVGVLCNSDIRKALESKRPAKKAKFGKQAATRQENILASRSLLHWPAALELGSGVFHDFESVV